MDDDVRQRLLERMRANGHTGTPEEAEKVKERNLRRKSLCKPDCQICGGTGYYRLELERTDEQFGKLLMCPNRATEKYLKIETDSKPKKGEKWENDKPLF